MFPELPEGQQEAALWAEIVRLCRLDRQDPVEAWRAHIDALSARRNFLNARRYDALRYRGPGTELIVGLPVGHVWVSAQSTSRTGITFAANLPTEEVFTTPHKDRVNGTVRGTKPLTYAGSVIDGFSLTFSAGRVVNLRADQGEEALRQIVATDEGAARLGEIALVPHSSPISQSGRLFYNTLFDENAASHIALGSAYRFAIDGGDVMTDEAFAAAGGNTSATHVNFMVGSGALDLDGLAADGSAEPLMRAGEWVG